MRASLPLLVLAALAPLAACTPTVTGGFGGLGGGEPSTATTWLPTTSVPTTSTSGTWGSSSSSSGSVGACSNPAPEGIPASACTPTDPSCGASASACLATTHAYGGPVFDLRIAQLTLEAPKPLTTGIVHDVFDSSTRINLPNCFTGGSGTFNWLLHVDETTSWITVGAGRPVADPHDGYSFIDETMVLNGQSVLVHPYTAPMNINSACELTMADADVNLPFFSDMNGGVFTIFPLHAVRFTQVQLTPDHDCIGSFDQYGLDPNTGCTPGPQNRAFLDGGQLQAYIGIEEADATFVPVIDQSLCVLLSGDTQTWGDGSSQPKCRRDVNGVISFKGDWCSLTNSPATASCADAIRFAGSFAASGTRIH
jgi:hypothetical protein